MVTLGCLPRNQYSYSPWWWYISPSQFSFEYKSHALHALRGFKKHSFASPEAEATVLDPHVRAHCTFRLAEIFAQNALGSAADWLFPPRASCSAQARAPRSPGAEPFPPPPHEAVLAVSGT